MQMYIKSNIVIRGYPFASPILRMLRALFATLTTHCAYFVQWMFERSERESARLTDVQLRANEIEVVGKL